MLSQTWPVGALHTSSCAVSPSHVLPACPHHSCPCFLVPQDILGSSCAFPAPDLGAAFSARSLVPLRVLMVLRAAGSGHQGGGCWSVLCPGPLSEQGCRMCVCLCTRVKIFTHNADRCTCTRIFNTLSALLYISVLKNTTPQGSFQSLPFQLGSVLPIVMFLDRSVPNMFTSLISPPVHNQSPVAAPSVQLALCSPHPSCLASDILTTPPAPHPPMSIFLTPPGL